MSTALQIASAIDKSGANPDTSGNAEETNTDAQTPRVKYNEELNGYHFHRFNETFICREELPQGSNTFQQVLDEITQELDSTTIPEEPVHVSSMTDRRKSVSVFRKTSDTGFPKNRRVSWGKPTTTFSDPTRQFRRQSSTLSFTRPRICSDGAVVRARKVSLRS